MNSIINKNGIRNVQQNREKSHVIMTGRELMGMFQLFKFSKVMAKYINGCELEVKSVPTSMH